MALRAVVEQKPINLQQISETVTTPAATRITASTASNCSNTEDDKRNGGLPAITAYLPEDAAEDPP